jgi:hypothetical protein
MVVRTQFFSYLHIETLMDSVNDFLAGIPWGPISIQYNTIQGTLTPITRYESHNVMIVYNTEPPETSMACGKVSTIRETDPS